MIFNLKTSILLSQDTYGFIAAVLTTVAFLPQLIKTYRTKSADDVSFSMLIMFIIGLVFWIIYAFKAKALPVLLANLITLILNTSILILKILFSKDINKAS